MYLVRLGTIRKHDANGRIQLPSEMRELLNIYADTDLNVYVENGNIIIVPMISKLGESNK